MRIFVPELCEQNAGNAWEKYLGKAEVGRSDSSNVRNVDYIHLWCSTTIGVLGRIFDEEVLHGKRQKSHQPLVRVTLLCDMGPKSHGFLVLSS